MVILKGVVLKEYTDIGKHNSGVVCVCFDVDREGWDVWLEFWGVQCQEGHFCVEKWRYDTWSWRCRAGSGSYSISKRQETFYVESYWAYWNIAAIDWALFGSKTRNSIEKSGSIFVCSRNHVTARKIMLIKEMIMRERKEDWDPCGKIFTMFLRCFLPVQYSCGSWRAWHSRLVFLHPLFALPAAKKLPATALESDAKAVAVEKVFCWLLLLTSFFS